jgi:hypothetical protein
MNRLSMFQRKVFMFSKSLMALAVAGAMFSGSAFAVPSPPPSITGNMVHDPADPSVYTGTFLAAAINNLYNVTFPTGAYSLYANISASSYANTGFIVTGATFDGAAFDLDSSYSKTVRGIKSTNSSWSYTLDNITSGAHHVTVTGNPLSSGAAGTLNVSVSAVPEPASIAMMLAGLALVGGLQFRGKNKTAQLAG